MTLQRHDIPLRGTRRTQRWARRLGWACVVGAFAVGGALGAGLWGSMRSDTPAPPLMNVPVSERVSSPTTALASPAPPTVEVTAEAPSRSTPELTATDSAVARVTPGPVVTFDGRPLRAVKTMSMKTTAYSPDERSCGKWADGITASGYSVWTNGGKLVAADTRLLPFGTLVSIPGYHGGKPVPVLDRGGAIKGHRLDLLYPTHEIALQWGVQDLEVTVWEYAD